jgi:hypothetical protein
VDVGTLPILCQAIKLVQSSVLRQYSAVSALKVGQTSLGELGNSISPIDPLGGWNSLYRKKYPILKAIYCLANRKVVLKIGNSFYYGRNILSGG